MPVTENPVTGFDPVLGGLLEPALTGLAAQLGSIPGLSDAERAAVRESTAAALWETVRRKANRVLLLELNAARVTGQLTAEDPAGRFRQWLERASEPGYWDWLTGHYPTLVPRLRTVIGNRCDAALGLARRFSTDRDALADHAAGDLLDVEFGAGDSHRGGRTVAILRCDGGRVVYKPRSLAVDAALARFVATLLPDRPDDARIRVPRVIQRDGYGWAEYVAHRYCADDRELRDFYRGIGHWLAVMRLLGGSDLHQENLIAAGPVPVVIDCETLFTPHPPLKPSGYGHAIDLAADLVAGSVLRTGLLPGRGLALGWRGVDPSAVGSLPGQQPVADIPVIVDGGTDRARIATEPVPMEFAGNHPSPDPVLGRYWDQVVSGFTEVTERLHDWHRAGRLESVLAGFGDCPVRVVARATEVYAELSRMLWHPASLHDQPTAVRRATQLLTEQSRNTTTAPADPDVIDAEVAELLDGDVPCFSAVAGNGTLQGPRGTLWEVTDSLIDHTVRRWHEADFGLDRRVIRAALVSAYLNEGWLPDAKRLTPSRTQVDDLDRRRRALAAGILRQTLDAAIHGEDGTVSWIAPVLNPTGWIVQPLSPDCYGGLAGVALVLAGYLSEVRHGRADEVPGVDDLFVRVLHSLRVGEDRWEHDRSEVVLERPDSPGGYIGLGSRIFGWLLLERLAPLSGEGVRRARALALQLPDAVGADDSYDIQTGMAGAVVPLLRLAQATGEARWTDLARDIGARLVEAARHDTRGARWSTRMFLEGIGGFSHGATGIGWALARLAHATGAGSFGDLAEAAFRFEESLYDEALGGWRDLREPGRTAAAWCHGAAGIGIAAADLRRYGDRARWHDVVRRAAVSCWSDGLGWNHTLCHGDLGAWELLDIALSAGVEPAGMDRTALVGHIVSSIEEYGPISGMARDVFAPGLLPGLGGVAYQLLRLRPECPLPSVLLPDPGEVPAR